MIKKKGYHPSSIGKMQTPSERKREYIRYMLLRDVPYKGRMIINRSYTVQESQDRVLKDMQEEGIVLKQRVFSSKHHADTYLVLNYEHPYVRKIIKEYSIGE